MTKPTVHAAAPSTPAKGRRTMFIVQAAIMAFALSACCALAIVLADRFPVFADVTSMGSHRLSEHTMGVLRGLPDPVRLVVAVRFGDLDRVPHQKLQDVLDGFDRASSKVSVQQIDVGSAKGVQDFGALLTEIGRQDETALNDYIAAVRDGGSVALQLSDAMDAVADALIPVRDALLPSPPAGMTPERVRAVFDGHGAFLRVKADDLRTNVTEATAILNRAPSAEDPLPVPHADLAANQLAVVLSVASQSLTNASQDLMKCAGPASGATTTAKDRAGALDTQIAQLRDLSARAGDKMDRLPRLRIFSVASAIKGSQAALLIGPQKPSPRPGESAPPSVAAIDLAELLAVQVLSGDGKSSIDLRFRAEELIAAGLTAFTTDPKPLVVLVHAGSARIAPQYKGFRQFVDRMNLRGMGIAEWAAALDDAEPKAVTEARNAKPPRPIVFVTVSPDVRDPEGAARMGRLSSRLKSLAAAGEAMLVSVNPSTLPAVNAADPMVDWLEELGVRADSGKVIVEELGATGAQSNVIWQQTVTDPGTDHRLGAAIHGLPTCLIAPIPLDIIEGPTSTGVKPLIALPPSASRWAESEWQQHRGGRAGVPPPRNDAQRDRSQGSLPGGAWMVAAAVERRDPSNHAPIQRVVVVGSNGWFADLLVARDRVIDGAVALQCPGNLEFAEASIWWLAQREDHMARSASAQAIPLIPALSAGQMSAIQWGVIAVMPLAVLLIGAAYLIRRR